MLQVRNLWVDSTYLLPHANTNLDQGGSPAANVWLFTDSLAKATYAQRGELDLLEQDIRTFVMFDDRWDQEELEFKQQVELLVDANWLVPDVSFAYVSPHPTIYKALRAGKIEISSERYHFQVGEEIIFASWPERLSHPGINGPLHIGRFDASASVCLCSQVYPQLAGLNRRELEGLHKIFCLPKLRKA